MYRVEQSINFSHTFDFPSTNLQAVVQCIFPCGSFVTFKHWQNVLFLFSQLFFCLFLFFTVAATITLSHRILVVFDMEVSFFFFYEKFINYSKHIKNSLSKRFDTTFILSTSLSSSSSTHSTATVNVFAFDSRLREPKRETIIIIKKDRQQSTVVHDNTVSLTLF